MGYRTSIQILLIIVSVVIITTYIRPTFDEMRETQDETKEYREALDNAAKFNEELQRLVNTANSLSTSERRALDRYLPNEVDTISVMRDIETIVENNQMELVGLGTTPLQSAPSFTPGQGQEGTNTGNVAAPAAHQFTLQVDGTYEQFKQLLQDFERNAYPLEAADITFVSSDVSVNTYSITLETYSLSSNVEQE